MEQLILYAYAAAMAFALLGGVHDLLTKRIPNWVTFPGMALGLAAQGWWLGWAGLGNGLLGILLTLALYGPIYAFGYMGAGDVKLLMAAGAWLGWWRGGHVAVVAVVIGAAYAFVEICWRGRLKAVAYNTYSFLRALFVPGLVAEKLKLDETRKFAFGLCIAGAVATTLWLEQAGRLR